MGVTVYNISATSVRVSWPPSPTCRDTFYSVMYDPNWNSLIMGYKRKSFKHEERIPVSQTGTHLANLLPLTAYFLCVTCQAADPVREQCKVFSTLSESSETHDRGGWEHMAGVWLTCCMEDCSLVDFVVAAGEFEKPSLSQKWHLLHHGCLFGVQDVVGEDPRHGHFDGELNPAAHREFQEELSEPKLGEVAALLQGLCRRDGEKGPFGSEASSHNSIKQIMSALLLPLKFSRCV
uniref:Fibronectin type-III domain-containing protein n=1 Tax=Oryzias latipes TaxID=8090 RepID=A0A3P9JEK0_ORYLA